MRTFDRTILVRTLCLVAVGAAIASPIACSTADTSVDPGDEAGTSDAALIDGGGGADTAAPDLDKACVTGSDCSSGVCGPDKKCKSPTSSDFVKNGDETDIDCGGANAKPCPDGKGCAAPKDCTSAVCTAGICAVPSATDGVKNGDETDKDCGGAKAPGCANGLSCAKAADCADKICTGGKCVERKPADGVQNGDETDIDCGGAASPACITGQMCLAPSDCDNVLCTANVCQPPTTTDGLKNGTESDVDCGGASGALCEVGKICAAHADCASDGCGYAGKCVLGRSCTQQHGGDTCGRNEFGPNAIHENCCEEIFIDPVDGSPKPAAPYYLDKYLVTAGRIRAFFERTGGDVRSFVENHPQWFPEWTDYMPTNMTEALANVGPVPLAWDWADGAGNQARGCQIEGGGARTFWQPPITANEKNYYPKEALDEKAIQCINLPLLLAFCLWDGKDLPLRSELQYAWTAGDALNHKYPWGNEPPLPATQFDTTNQYIVHKHGYMFPNYISPDSTYNIGAPGRRFLGAGPFGNFDMAGNVFEYARFGSGTNPGGLMSSGSWENHAPSNGAGGGQATWRRYYAFGGRCGHR